MWLKTKSTITNLENGIRIKVFQDVEQHDYDNEFFWAVTLVIDIGITNYHYNMEKFDTEEEANSYLKKIAKALDAVPVE